MANYRDGNWHAATIGQFVGQLVDEADVCVVFRQVSVTPHQGGKISTRYEAVLVADGQIKKAIERYRCKSVHKTLLALFNAGLID